MKRSMIVVLACVTMIVSLGASDLRASEHQGHVCFRTLDANQDGKVTMEEFTKAYPKKGQRLFEKADSNQDGVLVHGEYHDMLGHGADMEN